MIVLKEMAYYLLIVFTAAVIYNNFLDDKVNETGSELRGMIVNSGVHPDFQDKVVLVRSDNVLP
jgi:hypothetical protein